MMGNYNGKTYINGFRNVLRRVKAQNNCERYNSICTNPGNADEERIWFLCQKFWPKLYTDRNIDIDKYVANNCLDEKTAQKHLAEIHELLDKLGWEKSLKVS